MSLIYAKTLNLPAGLQDESSALTLMSTDIDRIATSMDSLNEVWARAVEISIGIWLLSEKLGWICVAPILIVVASIGVAGFVTSKIGARQRDWVRAVQRRVGITSSMLGSMKSIKMMGLSDSMFEVLNNQRIRELNLQKRFRVNNIWKWMSCELHLSVGVTVLT